MFDYKKSQPGAESTSKPTAKQYEGYKTSATAGRHYNQEKDEPSNFGWNPAALEAPERKKPEIFANMKPVAPPATHAAPIAPAEEFTLDKPSQF